MIWQKIIDSATYHKVNVSRLDLVNFNVLLVGTQKYISS